MTHSENTLTDDKKNEVATTTKEKERGKLTVYFLFRDKIQVVLNENKMKFSASVLLLSLSSVNGFVAQQKSTSRVSGTELFERKPFITGNWKLNPQTKDEAIELAQGIADAVTPESPGDVGLFVPFPFIESVQKTVGDKLIVGAEVR